VRPDDYKHLAESKLNGIVGTRTPETCNNRGLNAL